MLASMSSTSPQLPHEIDYHPPTTPPTATTTNVARQASSTPSDESSIFELSFDYQVDETGNVIRVSKGSSGGRSHNSSPPTPHESPHGTDNLDILATAYAPSSGGTLNHLKPPSPILLNSPAAGRRGSLSRSESAYPVLTNPSERTSASSSTPAAPHPRALQRTASGPAAMTPGTSSTRGVPLTGPRRTVGRPQRVTLEEYRETVEKHRLSDDEIRRGGLVEEKENLHSPVDEDREKRHSPPPIPTSRASGSALDRVTSGLPTRSTRALSDVVPVPQRHGRPIMPGPNRAGRVLKGVKYPTAAGFEKIAEVEGSDGEVVYPAEESDSAAEDAPPPPSSAPANSTARQRSYAGVNPTVAATALSLSQSGTRPRRSASLSDAATQEPRISPPRNHPSLAVAGAATRPGSSLGLGVAARARRVTLEEKMRQEREAALEQEEYERREAEEAERRLQAIAHAEAQAPSRQSPSPTHISNAPHLRPQYNHQRRDSDTLRSLAPQLQQVLQQVQPLRPHSASPVGDDNVPSSRPSPSSRNFPPIPSSSAAASLAARHRRSPTAPEPGTTSGALAPTAAGPVAGKTWAAGEERERDKSEERGALVRSVPQLHQPAPPPPPPASMTAPDVRSKNLFVNKKAYARLDMIGKGGSSRVYRVMNHANEIYAIKRVSLDKTDAETMSGYMNEIALLKRLEGNARIIRLVDSEVKAGPGGSKGHLMLVMECGEIDLARLLQEQQKEPMNMVWISYYWQQMLQAVHVIHEEKIVHSDLKPANFVLVRGQLKLIDFGIANAIANDTTNIQRDHQIGTVNYMSPEAIELPDGMRRLKVGRPSDVWSLGCILYQMVYGHPPFQHLSVYQKMKAIPDLTHIIEFPEHATPSIARGQESPKRLEHLKRRVRRDVIAGMKSCLCRNPKERSAIPELLEQDWLAMNEPEPPAAKELLAPDETIINPYYMSQLLQYGIKLGQAQNQEMSAEDLRREAERLVAELKALEP